MRTIAIDFETANEERRSACAVGLAWVENGQVTRRESRLIRPPEMRFNWHNTRIHGIRAEDVLDQPEFPRVMEEFWPEISGALVLAHNANFDVSVLCETMASYGQKRPAFKFLCTMDLSRHVWPSFGSVSLDKVARHFGIEFNHHDASEDAYACARVALAAASEVGADDVFGIPSKTAVRPGEVTGDSIMPCIVPGVFGSVRSIQSLSNVKDSFLSDELKFDVKGSGGNRYVIGARKGDNTLRVTCTCPAGQNKIWCKHRTALFNGDIGSLLSENVGDVKKLSAWARGCTVEPRDTRRR